MKVHEVSSVVRSLASLLPVPYTSNVEQRRARPSTHLLTHTYRPTYRYRYLLPCLLTHLLRYEPPSDAELDRRRRELEEAKIKFEWSELQRKRDGSPPEAAAHHQRAVADDERQVPAARCTSPPTCRSPHDPTIREQWSAALTA